MPDDPRDCCRAALNIMVGDSFEPPMMEAADAIEITWAALANSEGITPTAELARMLERAGTAMKRFVAELDRAHQLVRHGTGDHREFDKHRAEFRASRLSGQEGAA